MQIYPFPPISPLGRPLSIPDHENLHKSILVLYNDSATMLHNQTSLTHQERLVQADKSSHPARAGTSKELQFVSKPKALED